MRIAQLAKSVPGSGERILRGILRILDVAQRRERQTEHEVL